MTSYLTGYGQLDQVLQEIRPQDWDLPCFHRRGVVTIRDMVARRVQELAIHGWDIRSVFDPGHQLIEIEKIGDRPPNVTVTGSANDYLLLIYGRLKITDPETPDRFEIDGSREQAELFSIWFQGV